MFGSHRYVVAREVIVNLDSGNAIHGVIVRQTRQLLVLRNAELHQPASPSPTPIDGEAIVNIADVDFIQAL